ncbi:MAG: hypothetical protein LIO77_08555 [Rikenellaceae bacterium]|nr:hypothetical protein [Rikenellaceae bacterium]
MKRILFIILALAHIVSARATDPQYVQAMQQAVDSMVEAADKGSVIASRNRFEMIGKAYPAQWLPVYYEALCDLEAVYMDPRADDVQAILDDAKRNLDLLTESDSADMSEVNTLYGYYYMAIISSNPAQNGQKYFTKPTHYFEKAIRLDPANPRPVILRAFYNMQLPEFIRPATDADKEASRAAELFLRESPGIEKPFWGRGFY